MLRLTLLACVALLLTSIFFLWTRVDRWDAFRKPHVQERMPLSGTVLVTGAAGFIGFHLSALLLQEGVRVVGLDNLNDYYSVRLKQERLALLQRHAHFVFKKLDLADAAAMRELFANNTFSYVFHLAAQAGVRHSFKKPLSYVQSNLVGFVNIIEGMRLQPSNTHLLYASSSSVYGGNTKIPFSETDRVDAPLNLYAATKKSDEALAHSYASLYGIPMTGLRFFTVYGPWGRPDMAAWQFTAAILKGEPITLFNDGEMQRDFTYIDDVTAAVRLLMHVPPTDLKPPHRVVNIGNSAPLSLARFVQTIEAAAAKRALIVREKAAPGEVIKTFADVRRLFLLTGIAPRVEFCVGIQNFVDWYVNYQAGRGNDTVANTRATAAACRLP